MYKLRRLGVTTISLLGFSLPMLIALSSHANSYSGLDSIAGFYGKGVVKSAKSWWQRLFGDQKKGGPRGECWISPEQFKDNVTWSTKPMFVWSIQDSSSSTIVSRLEILDGSTTIWSHEVKPGVQQVTYQPNTSKPEQILKPGRTYTLLAHGGATQLAEIDFMVEDEGEARMSITNSMSQSTTVEERVNKFASYANNSQYRFFMDIVRETFSDPNTTPELQQQLRKAYCLKDSSDSSPTLPRTTH